MTLRIQPTTRPGRELVALAEGHAADFATRAARHDRDGTYPFENLAELKASGYLYAPVPAAHGGMGVDSVHDVLVAASRLAEGDPSTTVGVNMHLLTMMALARQHSIACNREYGQRAAAVGAQMEQIVRTGAVIGAAVSEPDQDLLRQKTRAVRDGDRWTVTGRKIISSLAPAATHFAVSVDYYDAEDEERYAHVILPRETAGVTVHDDWDALGLRASGSVSVSFEAAAAPNPPGRGAVAGVITGEFLEQSLTWGPAHATVSLGVAEAAHQEAAAAVAGRRERKGDAAVSGTAVHLAAENAIDLAAARGILDRVLALIDDHFAEHPSGYGTVDEAHALFAEAQAAKTFVNQAAVRIVDRAMTIVGGGAFMNTHPLSRLYRDARAGAFMQPLGANLAYEYIGGVALGMRPQRF